MALVRRAFAVLVCAIAIGSLAADLRFLDFFGPPFIVFTSLPLLSYAIVGSLLVIRRAGGPIGWLLGGAGALLQLVLLSEAYGYASLDGGAEFPGGEVALWFGSFVWIAPLGLVVAAMILFPDGRPPGRTFAILLWALVAFIFIFSLASAVAPQPIFVPQPYAGPHASDPPRSVPNPFALHGPLGDLLLLVASTINNLTALGLIAPLALAVRFRRSRGIERQQLKWLTYAAALTFGLMLIGSLPLGPLNTVVVATSVFGIGLLPVAIGIAVTRYHLYDIDVLINRTVVYGATTAAIAVMFFAGIVVLQALLRPLTSGSELAVAVSTLGSFALFQPVRRRVRDAVDRRFYRSRYDAARVVDSFAVRLRDEVDLDAVRADLLGSVQQTMAPAHMSLWLRDDSATSRALVVNRP